MGAPSSTNQSREKTEASKQGGSLGKQITHYYSKCKMQA